MSLQGNMWLLGMCQVVLRIKEELNMNEKIEVDLDSGKRSTNAQMRIWKIAHGRNAMSDGDHKLLLDNNLVSIGYSDPDKDGRNQRNKFVNLVKDGDFFYLIRNGHIVLWGKFVGDQTASPPIAFSNKGWVARKIDKIEAANFPNNKLKGEYLRNAGMPSNRDTLSQVNEDLLDNFKKTVLTPVFPLSYANLTENQTPTQNVKNEKIMTNSLNIILYGPPGTGKTFNTINRAIEIANPLFDINQKREVVKKEFDKLIAEGQIVFTTFHQSMSYEDFIEGIKPETINELVGYEVQPGIFKKLCEDALTPNHIGFKEAYEKLQKKLIDNELISIKTPTGAEFSISINSKGNLSLHTGTKKEKQGTLTKENIQKHISGEPKFIGWESYFKGVINYLETEFNYSSKNKADSKSFVLIIDEINRGNVSQIFGELITLIEDDKRIGKPEEIKVTLPYSKDKFGVPSNLYIIGTMNTADRSVEALDAALRRRFSFEEMPPIYEIIAEKGKLQHQKGIIKSSDGIQISLPNLLRRINDRIEKLIDRDHLIGHSYFMSVSNIQDLKIAFQNKIIPLLQEYFFGDYGKIGLVLGEDFFDTPGQGNEVKFSKFLDYDDSDYQEKIIYKLRNLHLMDDELFVKAIS